MHLLSSRSWIQSQSIDEITLTTGITTSNIITITEISSEIIVPSIIVMYYVELQNNGYYANYVENEWIVDNFSIVYNNLVEIAPELNMIDDWQYDNVYNDYSSYKIINREKLFENVVIDVLFTENYIYESTLSYTIMMFEIQI